MDYWAAGDAGVLPHPVDGAAAAATSCLPASVATRCGCPGRPGEGAHLAWPSDSRAFPGGRYGEGRCARAAIHRQPPARNGPLAHRRRPTASGEAADLQRIRGYRTRLRPHLPDRPRDLPHTELPATAWRSARRPYRYALTLLPWTTPCSPTTRWARRNLQLVAHQKSNIFSCPPVRAAVRIERSVSLLTPSQHRLGRARPARAPHRRA
jgi:hypothetical protein